MKMIMHSRTHASLKKKKKKKKKNERKRKIQKRKRAGIIFCVTQLNHQTEGNKGGVEVSVGLDERILFSFSFLFLRNTERT